MMDEDDYPFPVVRKVSRKELNKLYEDLLKTHTLVKTCPADQVPKWEALKKKKCPKCGEIFDG